MNFQEFAQKNPVILRRFISGVAQRYAMPIRLLRRTVPNDPSSSLSAELQRLREIPEEPFEGMRHIASGTPDDIRWWNDLYKRCRDQIVPSGHPFEHAFCTLMRAHAPWYWWELSVHFRDWDHFEKTALEFKTLPSSLNHLKHRV